MNQEIWTDIPGYEGIYAISKDGLILSKKRKAIAGNKIRTVPQRILAPRKMVVDKRSAYMTKLCLDGGSVHKTIAYWLLFVFVRPPKDGEVASFKDGDSSNYCLENLEWSTFKKIAAQAKNGGYCPPH